MMSANDSSSSLFRRNQPFYFTYQCRDLGFAEWIAILTLCLAPLVAHIFVGAPEPVVLAGKGPPWYQRMLHLNPTSIYWRYYAITTRHARTLESWGGKETAATSAIFWVNDQDRWDGSEDMLTKSKISLTTSSPKPRISPFSVSAAQTLLVTLQGVQALYILGKGIHLGGLALTVSLSSIFQPLAIAGLFRLPAAIFLTDDFRYTTVEPAEGIHDQARPASAPTIMLSSTPLPVPKSAILRRNNDPRAILWETFFLVSTAGLLALALWYFEPNSRITAGTYSTLLINIFYVFFLLVTFSTTLVYTVCGRNDTTIIPCIKSPFYMAYTCILFSLAVLVIILTALETRRTKCGVYTTYPERLGWDRYICPQ